MSIEFPLSQLYLTPRAVQTAQAAGVIAFGTNLRHMQAIYDRIKLEPALIKSSPTERPENLTVVVRWGGRIISRDVHFGAAAPNQPYLPANKFPNLDGEVADFTVPKRAIENEKRQIVEVDARPWRNPRFGAQYALGLMNYGNYPNCMLNAGLQLYFWDFSPEKISQAGVQSFAQEHYPDPIIPLFSPLRK